MKITHFISSPASGGAEVLVKDLSIAKSELGHNVHILFLSSASEIGRDTEYEKKYLSELSDAGVAYSFIGHEARRNPFFGVMKLKEHLKHFSPDILHCHLYYALVFSMFISGIRTVYTHHNIKLKIPSFMYKVFSMKVSAYVGICQICTDMLKKITGGKVYKIDNAVSLSRLIPKERYLNSNVVQILMVGHLSEQKNYSLLIDAVKLIEERNFIIKVAGEGPDFEFIRRSINSNGLGSKVQLLGNVSNVPSLMSEADIFAMTSCWEGLPISLIEATLTGLPTIVTNVGGCAEVSHQSLNGLVVDSHSSEDYAEKLSILIDSFELRRELSKNALTYSDNYKLQNCVEKHIQLYSNILSDEAK